MERLRKKCHRMNQILAAGCFLVLLSIIFFIFKLDLYGVIGSIVAFYALFRAINIWFDHEVALLAKKENLTVPEVARRLKEYLSQ